MKETEIKKDQWLWKNDEMCPGTYFIYSGNYEFVVKPELIKN